MLTFEIHRELLKEALTQKNSHEIIAVHFVKRLLPSFTIHDMKIVESNARIITRVHHSFPSQFVTYKLPDDDSKGFILTQIAKNYSEFYLLGYLPKEGITNYDSRSATRFYRDELKAFGLWNSVECKRRD